MPFNDKSRSRAYALMGDWIVHSELTQGQPLEHSKFEPNVMTQSYIWSALEVLCDIGVLREEIDGRNRVFYGVLESANLMDFLEGKEIEDDDFNDMFCAFTSCGELNCLVAKSPDNGFLTDEKSAPIFESLVQLSLCRREGKLIFWNPNVRSLMARNYLWQSEDISPALEAFERAISPEARKVLDQFSEKHRSAGLATVSKVYSEKIFFFLKGLRKLPRSDHGILTRVSRDAVIPVYYIPDEQEIARRFMWMGCSNDDFMYFGQDTPIAILKTQALLVLKKDTGKKFRDDFGKKVLEDWYPNPWGVVKETKTWVY